MDAEDLRLAVYRTFAGTGRAPDAGELAAVFGVELAEGFLRHGIARCLAGRGARAVRTK